MEQFVQEVSLGEVSFRRICFMRSLFMFTIFRFNRSSFIINNLYSVVAGYVWKQQTLLDQSVSEVAINKFLFFKLSEAKLR